MYQQKSILTITGIVIEALFLAFVAFCFADYVLFLIRTGQLPAFRYIANALIVFAPGIFLIWADVLARVLMPNMEIPIGVITSAIGAPIFVYMMIRKSYGFGGR